MKRTIPTVLAIALLSLNSFAAPKIGEPAPAFKGTTDLNETIQLDDFSGSYVVMEWLNHGCPFVKKFYKSGEMQRLQEKMTDAGVVWISVNSSAHGKQGHMKAAKSAETRDKHGSKASHLLIDSNGKVGKAYSAMTTPHMYVIDPDGVLIYQGAIDSISSTKVDDIAKAENYVVSAWMAHKDGKEVKMASTRPYGCSIKY